LRFESIARTQNCFHDKIMGLNDFTFYNMITRNALCFRDRQAWLEVEDGRTLTFGEYKEKVDQLAKGVSELGVRKGDRIGILGKNSLEYFFLYGAAAALGAIMLPINWRLSPEEVCFNLNDCTPRIIFLDSEYQGFIDGIKDRLPSVENFVNLGPEGGRFLDFGGLLNNPGNFVPPDVTSEDGFVIMHTAAVGGRPKGALLSHGNIWCANMHLHYYLHETPEDSNLNVLPIFHIGGLCGVMVAFHAGALNVNLKKFDAEKTVELITERKGSVLFELAPILASILDQSEKSEADISCLRAVVGIDRPEAIERYQRMTGGVFFTLYGQTEVSAYATFGSYNDRPGAAGRPVPFGEVRIVDDSDRGLGLNEVGEIVIRGPHVFRGYWNLDEANAYCFRNGWHHTGDLGRLDEDGFLWYEGRKADKELIKPGGENVYPAEVENVIQQHPAIERAVVFGVPDPKWHEGIKAVCQLKAGYTLGAQELIDFVGARIARYKKPQYVEFINNFPVSADVSADRNKIKELYGGSR